MTRLTWSSQPNPDALLLGQSAVSTAPAVTPTPTVNYTDLLYNPVTTQQGMASVSLILNVKVLIFPAIFTGGSTSAPGGGFEDPLKHRHPSNPSSTASATTEGLGSGAKKDQQNSYLKELEAQIRSAFSTIACLRIIGIFHIKQKSPFVATGNSVLEESRKNVTKRPTGGRRKLTLLTPCQAQQNHTRHRSVFVLS